LTAVIFYFCAAFEFTPPAGAASAMLAGGALGEWQHAFALNPALAAECRRAGAAVIWFRPYNLEGVTAGRVALGMNSGRWAWTTSYAQTASGNYHENDIQVDMAARPIPAVAVGVGVHALIQDMGVFGADAVPAFDAGVCWQSGQFRFGAALLRANEPKLRNGDELLLRVIAGAAWRPVETLVLAADVVREETFESFGLGLEFELIPQLKLRCGLGTEPVRYAAGLGVVVGPVGLDYGYQFHPQLRESHLLGLRLLWR